MNPPRGLLVNFTGFEHEGAVEAALNLTEIKGIINLVVKLIGIKGIVQVVVNRTRI